MRDQGKQRKEGVCVCVCMYVHREGERATVGTVAMLLIATGTG